MTADPLTTLESARLRYLEILLDFDALRFGDFTTKSGRRSPYFIDSGRLNSGRAIQSAAECYAALIQSLAGPPVDILFGPAYKGIPLAVATSEALSRATQRDTGWLFNRKEAKDHGEGGVLVGAPVQGRVLIVDDVMSAGTAARESIAIIQAAGAKPHAVALALDRQEKATENGQDVSHSAVQYVRQKLSLQVCAIARLADLLQYLQAEGDGQIGAHYAQVLAYRERYGVED